ncbi:sensor domain-containing diguanylate cyclase [Kineosporia sp. J2-2]|uniref:Sensor domain-containing diguanylate cyclase n=1 Tax=Kineosporia corallincola TaxID=2835133 RepID=A0ABS5TE51_9ACTN|nr:sensor domain-containing diguanylate cyclase [Kineosporia corallincola]MBT0769350.1 sensor domain-containing diguanylate cyclase [Kineosporia corallincola]
MPSRSEEAIARSDEATARIQSLAAVARALGLSVRLDQMLELAAESALDALGASSISISRLQPGTSTLQTLINVGDLAPDEVRWPTDETYHFDDYPQARQVLSELQTLVTEVEDPLSDPHEVALLRRLDKRTALAAPLIVDGQLWGEFYATRDYRLDRFAVLDLAYTEALCAILAGALSRAIHFEALEQLAFRDPLTGLANRRALDDAASVALQYRSPRPDVAGHLAEVLPDQDGRARHRSVIEAASRRVSAVAVDVNGLKRVNDTTGHAAGDQLLTSVARLLVQHFSPLIGSLIARVGGDEFVVLVPNHSVPAVLACSDAFCAAASGLPAGAGVSCGVASTTQAWPHLDATDLFRAADQAQYEAKRLRSRTAVLSTSPIES